MLLLERRRAHRFEIESELGARSQSSITISKPEGDEIHESDLSNCGADRVPPLSAPSIGDERLGLMPRALAIDDRWIAFKMQSSAPVVSKKQLQVLEKRQ